MKTITAIFIVVAANLVVYFFRDHFSTAFLVALADVTILFIIVFFASSNFVKQKEIRRLDKELNRIRFRVEDGQRETQILHALNNISESFVHETNLDVIFEQTQLAIKKILDVDIAALFLCDADTKTITRQINKGIEELEVDKPVLERIIQKGSSVLINQLSPNHTEFKSFRMLYHQEIKSMMIAPIVMKDKTIGLLGIFTKSDVDFTGADLRILSTFSTHVSIIMENGRLLEEKQRLAITDEMTQLYNYRHFRQRLKEEFSRAERYTHPLSLVIFDIDYFKNYNDTHGHPMGDNVLRKMSSLLKENIRTTDFAARYGGEEFVIILVETEKEVGQMLAEKFRKVVQDAHFEYQEQQPNKNLTISLGVANFPTDAKTPEELINRADKALYKAKESGRNQVRLYAT